MVECRRASQGLTPLKHILIALTFALAAPALACTSPETGTLRDLMEQATWTTQTDYAPRRLRTVTVYIAFPALAASPFSCLQWRVELVLPPGYGVGAHGEGQQVLDNLASDASSTFDVTVPPLWPTNPHYVRGWLQVKVRNPSADAGAYLAEDDGSPLLWLYPVTFKVSPI